MADVAIKPNPQITELIDLLNRIAESVPFDAEVRINGVPMVSISVTQHNPIGDFEDKNGLPRLARDKAFPPIVDIRLDGLESPRPPVIKYRL